MKDKYLFKDFKYSLEDFVKLYETTKDKDDATIQLMEQTMLSILESVDICYLTITSIAPDDLD